MISGKQQDFSMDEMRWCSYCEPWLSLYSFRGREN